MNRDIESQQTLQADQTDPVLPYTYAKQKGVTWVDNTFFCRQGISWQLLLEVRRVMGEPSDIVNVDTALFDHNISAC